MILYWCLEDYFIFKNWCFGENIWCFLIVFDEDRNIAYVSFIIKCINLFNMLNVYVY